MLVCKACGKKVLMSLDGVPIRTCLHNDATIVASLKAVVSGKGGM